MAKGKRRIQIEIDANTKKAVAAMGQIDNSVRAFARSHARSMQQHFGEWNRLKMSIMAVNSAIGIVQTAISGLRRVSSVFVDMSRAAMAQADVLRRLGFSIELHGHQWDEVRGKVLEYAAATQRLTGIGDDVTERLMAQMAAITAGTGQSVDSLIRLTDLSMDIARQTGRDAETIGLALAKMYAGQETAISRVLPGMSVELRRLEESGAGANEMIAAMARQFGGARLQIDPLVRDLGRLKSGWGDLKEALGDALNEALSRSGAIGDLADAIDSMASSIAQNGAPILSFLGSLAGMAIQAAASVMSLINALGRMVYPVFPLIEPPPPAPGQPTWETYYPQLSEISRATNRELEMMWLSSEERYEAERRWREDLARQIQEQGEVGRRSLLGGEGLWGMGAGGRSTWGTYTLTGGTAAQELYTHPGQRPGPRGPGEDPLAALRALKEESMALTLKTQATMETVRTAIDAWRAMVELFSRGFEPTPKAPTGATGKASFADWLALQGKARAEEFRGLAHDIFGQLPLEAGDALTETFDAVGQFVAGTQDAFERLGESIKTSLGNTFRGIGSAFIQSAVQIALSPTGGPLGMFFAIGGLFSLLGGLLTGRGGGRGGGGTATIPALLSVIRPEMAAGQGSVIHQHLHIGAIFADHDEAATHAVARYASRARDFGEWRL